MSMTMAEFNTTASMNESSTDFQEVTTQYSTTIPANATHMVDPLGCIPAEVAFVVMASVGSLVVFLLASILVLSCQVCRLQRRRRSGRHARSNVDLVSGTGYWGVGTQAEGGGGIVGPCDTSVMLEEVKEQEEFDSRAEEEDEEEAGDYSMGGSEVLVTAESRAQPGITVAPVGELVKIEETDPIPALIPPPPPPPPPPMPGAASRESCLEPGRNLEDMPLVV